MSRLIPLNLIFIIFNSILIAQPSDADIERVLAEINQLRSTGCKCGPKRMVPVRALRWDHDLYVVSNKYAKYMARNNHFNHISKKGEDLGDRLDDIGFKWSKIGENLGMGYDHFFEVLQAWLDSPPHCRMLMDPDMTHMGMSKHREYWVQSFNKGPYNLGVAAAH